MVDEAGAVGYEALAGRVLVGVDRLRDCDGGGRTEAAVAADGGEVLGEEEIKLDLYRYVIR